MLNKILISTLLFFGTTIKATANQTDSIETTYNLDEIVVTGTRTPKMLKDTPVQTRLITSSEIERSDATGIQDLLQQEIPGVEFSFAMNQQLSMNLSGFSGQGILILLNGERLAGETMENTDFDRLNMSGVSRIEIVRGAASAIYGSEAVGGVINIITKEADRSWSLNLNARGGRHNQWRIGGRWGIKSEKFNNSLDINHYRIDTYRICKNITDQCDFREIFGYHWWNFSDRLVYAPIDALKLTAHIGYFFKQRFYNPDIPDRYRDFSLGIGAEWQINNNNKITVNYNFDQYDKSDFLRVNHRDIRDYSNVRNSLRSLYTLKLREDDALLIGGDITRDYLMSYQFSAGETHDQYTGDIFAQYDYTINSQWEVIGAIRWDYYSDNRNSYATTKLSGRFRTGSLTLRGGYAGGFRAPSLKEKYMKFDMAEIFDIHGNPDLHAEKSHNFNLSAEYTFNNWYINLGTFYNIINDRITTSGIRYDEGNHPYINYLNVKRLRVFGAEAGLRVHWNCGISFSLAYNFTHEQTIGGGISQYCPARPHSMNTRISWTHSWLNGYNCDISLSGRFLSQVKYTSMQMYEPFEKKLITNPAYTIWKLQLSQQIYHGIKVTLAIDNLLNYIPHVYCYNSPITEGTDFRIGMSIDIDNFF